jgi:poly-gamma-glutamate synthesis protein (capsule biosynthesis protein)
VIVVPRADKEFLPVPAPYIQEPSRSLIDAGASAVIAHHPHVPRGVELYEGCPVFYSQGNFLFWQDHPGLFRKLGFLVKVSVFPEGNLHYRMIPYRIAEEGLQAMNRAQEAWFFRELKSVSGEALSHAGVRRWWNAAIDAISEHSWYSSCTGMDYGFGLIQKRNPIGLARLHTRLSSPSHTEFMIAGINRILSGEYGTSDPADVAKVKQWTEAEGSIFPQ